MAKILLTGSNGYIGRLLLPILALQGHKVVCLVRDKRRLQLEISSVTTNQIIEGDLLRWNDRLVLPRWVVETPWIFGGCCWPIETKSACCSMQK